MRRTRDWAQRGRPAIEEASSARGVSHTIIGAISAYGVVREPGNIKKRQVVGAKKRKAPEGAVSDIPKGTKAGHFMKFISDTLDIMDEFPNMKGFHIVIDNPPIHPSMSLTPSLHKEDIFHLSLENLSLPPYAYLRLHL